MDIEDLYELIRKDDVCLFIGAGFSIYAGYPSGTRLAQIILGELANDERKKISEQASLSKVAQDFVTIKKGDRSELIRILRSELLKKPTDTFNHDVLSRISFFRTIITTNYDSLIEDSYTSRAVVISKPVDVNIIQSSKVKIFKIHGDIHDSNSIVITDKDYSNLYGSDYRNPFWASVISELSSKHVIFLGYGYEDLNIWSIFEKILEHTKDQGRKRFFISPSISELKEDFLTQNNIVPYKITGETFLNGLLENIKNHLKDDVENKSVSVQTALEVFNAHNLKVQLDASTNNNWIRSIEKVTGKTEAEIQFQISDKKVIEKYKKFINGYGGINLTFKQKELASFSYSIEGFSFLNFENLAKLTVQVPPVFTQTCTIQFIEDDFEVEDITYDVYNKGKNKLLVKTKIEDFDIEINIDLSKQPEISFKVNISEPKQLASINSAIKIYNLAYLIFSSKFFNIHFKGAGSLLNQSLDGKQGVASNSNEKVRFYKALKRIEQCFNTKFQNIKTADLHKYVTQINSVITLIETKKVNVDEEDGALFRAEKYNEKLINALKSSIENEKGILSWIQEKQFIEILGQNLDLGRTKVLINEPYISEETETSVRIKSKGGKITLMYEKFGFKEMANSKVIW